MLRIDAGMMARRVPRMRGDDPKFETNKGPGQSEFPACAGMIRLVSTFDSKTTGVPRMRGDDPQARRDSFEAWESSPHARG